MKKLFALMLALVLCLCLAAPAMAEGSADPERKFETIAAGSNSSFVIDNNGDLWAWGDNYNGRLGDGTKKSRPSPIRIMEQVIAVSASDRHAAAIQADGSLWTWGINLNGQLGNGTYEVIDSDMGNPVPTKVLDDVVSVSAGGVITAAVRSDGSLWVWGAGQETYKGLLSPKKMMDDVTAVSAGYGHVMAIKTDGTLWAWGNNDYGQLGYGEPGYHWGAHRYTPQKIMDDVAAVSAGRDFTMAIKTDGSLWAWGENWDGQCGNGTYFTGWDGDPVPKKVMDDVAAVSAGHSHAMIIKTDGSLWACGTNEHGQLGDSDVRIIEGGKIDASEMRSTPVKIMDHVEAVAAGNDHTIARTTNGAIWAWGGNDFGQLGYRGWNTKPKIGNGICQTTPKRVSWEEVPVIVSAGMNPEASGQAYAVTQPIQVDGKEAELQTYALRDEEGGMTSYVMVRDVAKLLTTTRAAFGVDWGNGTVYLETDDFYRSRDGQEDQVPFSGDRPYVRAAVKTKVDGQPVELQAFVLTDDNGGGYTYYKLRDLGKALGFTVDWSAERGTYIETE